MCGILGFENTGSRKDLRSFASVLHHRGPDGTGYFQDDLFSFVHWRLSIIDLSEQGAQPFYYENLVLVYNGEIYNFREVAHELEGLGYHFTTQSDSEVLIKSFHCWKEKAVDHFRGMFAFAIYNKLTGEIFLFRDRMGVKPMYYSLEKGLSFGSEMKVFRSMGIKRTLDPVGLHHYFRLGYCPGEQTIFREIKKLLPGHYLKYAGGKASTHAYWTLPLPKNEVSGNEDETIAELEQILTTSFQYRMVSDVPVGIFLSGGIDSSLVATLLQRNATQPIKTFTIGFDQQSHDETVYARRVAERLQTDHTELRLEVRQARELFDNFYEIYDEPFSDTSGIPTALVSSLAKQHGTKVVLSADGADEWFGGYPHYTKINSLFHRLFLLPPQLRKAAAYLLRTVFVRSRTSWLSFNIDHRLSKLEELLVSQSELQAFEGTVANQSHSEINRLTGNTITPEPLFTMDSTPCTAQQKMMYWDARYYLPDDLMMKVDRATMYNSIEGREPYLDHRIAEYVQQLPLSLKIRNGETKYVLRKILLKYFPAAWFERPKQGFSIPIFSWFSQDLDKLFGEYLNEASIKKGGILNEKVVAFELKKYRYYKSRGQAHNLEKMWRLLSFVRWHNRWMN